MHDIKSIRDDLDGFRADLLRRNPDEIEADGKIASLIELDDGRIKATKEAQSLREQANTYARAIGEAMKTKDTVRAQSLKDNVLIIKTDIGSHEKRERDANRKLNDFLATIPNRPLPAPIVPDGPNENFNREERRVGDKPVFPEGLKPREHFEIGESLGMMDFEAAARMSGARFVVLKGKLARLERALAQFMLDLHTEEHGFQEVAPPLLVRDHAMFGTAQLPKFREDQYFASTEINFNSLDSILDSVPGAPWLTRPLTPKELKAISSEIAAISEAEEEAYSNLNENGSLILRKFLGFAEVRSMSQSSWLIPTAEVPLTNLVREQILDESTLPLRMTAGTACFRAEAGAAGRDTRGIIRQHQFTKVELVSITTPEQSLAEHDYLTKCAEEVLKRLKLPYRVVTLCTGDMGFASQKTYDIEVWLPGQNRYREISSCSVCGDFQARRMGARYRPAEGKGPRFVHTLNGSGVAVGRALVAVLENYQNPDGSVSVPEALRPYMGGVEKITQP